MNSYPQSRSTSAGFTLVELLTVIAIIAILMALLFPAINTAREQARKAQAKADAVQIVAAVKAYYSEYGKYPLGANVTTSGNPTDFTFGQSSTASGVGSGVSNQQLFDILRNLGGSQGMPNPYNPRAIIFFDGKTATDSNNPRAGFVPSTVASGGTLTAGAYMDPWGSEYFIAVDADYNNQLTTLPYSDFQGTTNGPYTGVGVFSVGKDGIIGSSTTGGAYKSGTTTSDDIISWQ